MTHPTIPLSSLSDDAKRLYDVGSRGEQVSLTLDRDWFRDDAHRMSAHAFREEHQLDPDFAPGDRLTAAVSELVDAGYAWHSHSNRYGIHQVDADLFTTAHGTGPWLIKLHRVQRVDGGHPFGSRLLAVLDGAEITTGDRTRIECRIPDARDEEHDPAYAARIEIALPSSLQLYGKHLEFFGVAGDANLYPLGADPLLRDSRDATREIPERIRCEDEHCQGSGDGRRKHYIAPYLPPAIDLKRTFLRIKATMRPRPDTDE